MNNVIFVDNSQAYYEDEYEQGPPAPPSGFFHHDNLKNHKLDTTTERFYQEEFYGANSNQDQAGWQNYIYIYNNKKRLYRTLLFLNW